MPVITCIGASWLFCSLKVLPVNGHIKVKVTKNFKLTLNLLTTLLHKMYVFLTKIISVAQKHFRALSAILHGLKDNKSFKGRKKRGKNGKILKKIA